MVPDGQKNLCWNKVNLVDKETRGGQRAGRERGEEAAARREGRENKKFEKQSRKVMQQGDCSSNNGRDDVEDKTEGETWTCGKKRAEKKKRHLVTSSLSHSRGLSLYPYVVFQGKGRCIALPYR